MRETRDRVSSLERLRVNNSRRILNHLRRGEAGSRAELARITGLNAKTITNLINILLKRGLVRAEGMIEATGGRPAEQVRLNPSGGYAVGVDVGSTGVRALCLALDGTVRACRQEPLISRTNGVAWLAQVETMVQAVVDESGPIPHTRFEGIGVVLPASVDRVSGAVGGSIHLPYLKDVGFAEALGARFSVRVFLDEATRGKTLGEWWLGVGRECSDFVCLDLGYRIGVGMVTHGRLHDGASGACGALGHNVVKVNGAPCRCGHNGCLETLASGEALERLAGESGESLAGKARAGDRRAVKMIADVGRALGMATASLVNILNPGRLVLSGGLCHFDDLLIEPFKAALVDYALNTSLAAVRIDRSRLGDPAGAIGAAVLALKPLFELDA
jgi:predicted NBD/HSP70 family sugar kinase